VPDRLEEPGSTFRLRKRASAATANAASRPQARPRQRSVSRVVVTSGTTPREHARVRTGPRAAGVCALGGRDVKRLGVASRSGKPQTVIPPCDGAARETEQNSEHSIAASGVAGMPIRFFRLIAPALPAWVIGQAAFEPLGDLPGGPSDRRALGVSTEEARAVGSGVKADGNHGGLPHGPGALGVLHLPGARLELGLGSGRLRQVSVARWPLVRVVVREVPGRVVGSRA